MKKRIKVVLTVFAFVLSYSLSAQLIRIDTLYDSDKYVDKIIYTYKDSIVNNWYWENGQIRRRFTLDSLDNCIGKTIIWYKDGSIRENGYCFYNNRVDTTWYENRVIQSIENIILGEGKQLFFDEEGRIISILYF